VAFVREPVAPEGTAALLRALFALTTLLIVVAVGVAYAVGRDASQDVEFVGERVRGMVRIHVQPAGEPVPVRTMDEVGALTVAFNALVTRFSAAQASYQEDLGRVRAADRDRAAFLAAVSHELRSPLNAVLGFADLLMAEVDGPLSPEAREEVDQIRGSGKHLLDIINDILELSALESGQLRFSRARVDLWSLAWDVIREAAVLVGTRHVALRVHGDEGVCARADPKRMRQILTNLVGNAIKFTERGEVVVDIGREGRYALVSVRDTGQGIRPQDLAAIFQEYKQTQAERSRRRGTGLGLAITRRLVTMQGGSIHVHSAVGRGSVFEVLLPIWKEPRTGLV
jgi:signal transduction histidine kinase